MFYVMPSNSKPGIALQKTVFPPTQGLRSLCLFEGSQRAPNRTTCQAVVKRILTANAGWRRVSFLLVGCLAEKGDEHGGLLGTTGQTGFSTACIGQCESARPRHRTAITPPRQDEMSRRKYPEARPPSVGRCRGRSVSGRAFARLHFSMPLSARRLLPAGS
jgi:hypothetical protein